MGDADLWEMLKQAGIAPDSATAIVQSHKGLSDPDLWERLVQNGAQKDAATRIVQARGGDDDGSSLTLGNAARSLGMGATYGMGSSTSLPSAMRLDPAKARAFAKANPTSDFLLRMAGGALAPIAAAAAAPELATGALAAAGTGAAAGAVGAMGEDSDQNIPASERLKRGAVGAAVGAPLGLLGHGLVAGAIKGGGAIADRLMPARAARNAVSGAAAGLIDDPGAVAARMDEIDKLAPGGSSPASASVAPATAKPWLSRLVRGVGADTDAGRAATTRLTAQADALAKGQKAIGSQIDALNTDVTISPRIRAAMAEAKRVLGGAGPELPPASSASFPAPAGFQPTSQTYVPPAKTVGTADMRDLLSRLSFKMRGLLAQGTDANGVNLHDVAQARAALRSALYGEVKGFQPLDTQYAKLSDELRAVEELMPEVERSRMNHGGNSAYGTTAGSIGGSLPQGAHSVAMTALDNLLAHDKGAAAREVSRAVLAPGDGSVVRNLLKNVPQPWARTSAAAKAATSGISPSLLHYLNMYSMIGGSK